MAITRKYDEQMPFVGTKLMKDTLDQEADERRTSVAQIIRDMIDERYLMDDGVALTLEEQAELADRIAARATRRATDLMRQVREAKKEAQTG